MQPRNFEEPRKPTSARHQTAPAPRLQSSIEPRQRSETGSRRATEEEDKRGRREKGGGGGETENPRSSGGLAGRPAQVRKPWISEARSGSRLPVPPAMVALLLLPHTLSTCALSLALTGEKTARGGGRRLENREKSHKVTRVFHTEKRGQTITKRKYYKQILLFLWDPQISRGQWDPLARTIDIGSWMHVCHRTLVIVA